MQIDLSGKNAIVTGGASGLGRAIAQEFLRSGARVILWDVNAAGLEEVGGQLGALGPVSTQLVDVSRIETVESAVEAAYRSGEVDILVNSAGINRKATPIADYLMSDWHDIIAINLTGTFHCCRLIIPRMVKRGSGRVINLASMAGKDGNAMMPAYSASKAGVMALTKSLGKELARTGVLINAIAPTMIDTAMNRKSTAAAPELFKKLVEAIPMGRRGTEDELAALATWIASDHCSFSTGFVFDMSGGRATY